MRSRGRVLVLLALAAVLVAAASSPAAGADHTYVVNTTADGMDANPGDGVCATQSGFCTLRAALMEANHTNGIETVVIQLPADGDPYVLTILPKLPGDHSEGSGALKVARDVRLLGGGAARTIIDGNATFRVFALDSSVAPYTYIGAGGFQVSDVTIRNGSTSGYGGGIYADEGSVTLLRCIVRANTAGSGGGGIGAIAATSITAVHSTISGNMATAGPGGAIWAGATSNTTIDASTISGNTASTLGGGLYALGTGYISYSTIADNTAGTDGGSVGGGGGLYQAQGSMTVYDTIVSGNHHTVPGDPPTIEPNDCTGTFQGSDNLVSTKTSCLIAGLQADPLLGPLQLDGGPLPTHALLAGSPAIDAGDAFNCAHETTVGDERGAHRPAGATCDIGAYEYAANGDVNGDGKRDVADVFYLVNFLFAGGAAPMGLGDVNGDTATDVADVFFMINFLFAGGSAPL